jgi:hypothetical protein
MKTLQYMVTHVQIDFREAIKNKEATMYAVRMLQKYFKKSLSNIHIKRIDRLLLTAESLLSRARLTLTSLGRHTKGPTYVKHKIKAVDRVLGNRYILKERVDFYKSIAKKLIGGLTRIDIIVDWSPAGNHENHILRASLLLNDCSMTLYEEVHPQKLLGNYKVHEAFLEKLKLILPAHVRPVIITDAGFKANWFKLILSYGWDFEGRACDMYYKLGNSSWEELSKVRALATHTAKRIGQVLLAKKHKLACEMYVYRGTKKDNSGFSKAKKYRNNFAKETVRYKKQYKEPWVIVTSISIVNKNPKKIINRYKRRMKIEHGFRSLKNDNWGLGLNETKTRNPNRLSIMLLIASLAMLILWLIGMVGEQRLLHYRYQVNSIKKHRVLSIIFLGLQIIEHGLEDILRSELSSLFGSIQNQETLQWQQ